MTNMIDEMSNTADALRVAGDDIASARLDRARRDRIRGAITQAAADAALSAAKKHLTELVTPKRQIESIFDMFADHGVKVTTADQLPGPRPLGQGFVLRQGDDILSVPGSVIRPAGEQMRRETPVDPGADVRSESSAFAQRTPVDPPRRELPFRRTFEKRIEAKPYEGGGYHSTGMTLAELRGLVATLAQAGCPEERFVKIRTTDGNPPELIIDAGGWRVDRP